MAFEKKPRGKATLLGRLSKLLGTSPKAHPSRVAQPGARSQKVETSSRSHRDEGFGKRKPRNR
ncbi:MAG: hypothetical protein WAU90_11265 [Methyloceanibacter sp.]|jgi:hypothetical protein